MTTSPTYLIFDLESTGLRENADHILELGAIAVDDEFNKLATYSALVHVPMSLIDEALDSQMKRDYSPDTFVREMHTKNGLLAELAAAEAAHIDDGRRRTQPAAAYDDASDAFIAWLTEQGYKPGTIIMAGHSIGVFDHPWVKLKMPRVGEWFSYRTEDQGAIARYLRRCGAQLYETPKDAWPHRGLADCEIELAEAQAGLLLSKNAFELLRLYALGCKTLGDYLPQLDDPFALGQVPATENR